MKRILRLSLGILLSQTSLAQGEANLHCQKGDSVNLRYFGRPIDKQSLKKVNLERGKMIVEFMQSFDDTVTIIFDGQLVFEGKVKDSSAFLPSFTSFILEVDRKRKSANMQIYLRKERSCIDFTITPKFKRLAISRSGRVWYLVNSNYMPRVYE